MGIDRLTNLIRRKLALAALRLARRMIALLLLTSADRVERARWLCVSSTLDDALSAPHP